MEIVHARMWVGTVRAACTGASVSAAQISDDKTKITCQACRLLEEHGRKPIALA